MHDKYIFSSVVFEQWKQKARALKRSSGLLHHEALDEIAKQLEFTNWRHVVSEAKLNQLSQWACLSGLVVAYDIKDATDNWITHKSFVDDSRALYFCRDDIWEWYRRTDDEAEPEERRAIPTDPVEYRREFNEWLTNVYLFRYTGSVLPASPTKVLSLLSKRCFFAPMFFWYRGRFIDPCRDLVIDDVLDMDETTEPDTE